MSASLINRSLNNIRNELEFLKESNVISGEPFHFIDSNLPGKWDENSKSANNASTEEYVEALYDFEAQQDGDLSLKTGDKIQILEKISPDWYKGKANDMIGIFPANYVKPAFTRSTSPDFEKTPLSSRVSRPSVPPPSYEPAFPEYSSQQVSAPNVPPLGYVQAPPQQQNQAPLPYPPSFTNYYQQPQQQCAPAPQQAQPLPQQQSSSASGAFKSFGSKLGDAAIEGAGSTIGSDITNSTF
ncbi:Lsb1p [Saccharomyces cerevisiae x Saccharomyces kudriavzevii VIN7]|uniref:Lsb1p n=1 Tax=Saccharomyces cerevisiae x Saccharomyces kudriavzevii (strain VIN7) TaxID=1095631 RepID=H0GV66_SACCK|nr:Lsb1p [Saccharomyces cerevisiae x Saccharomyces kudriavzevii VIN7]